jgi:hypothetical protein
VEASSFLGFHEVNFNADALPSSSIQAETGSELSLKRAIGRLRLYNDEGRGAWHSCKAVQR